jgi:hypothetical protein
VSDDRTGWVVKIPDETAAQVRAYRAAKGQRVKQLIAEEIEAMYGERRKHQREREELWRRVHNPESQ